MIGNPCDRPEQLDVPFVQPFDKRRTSISDSAREVRCLPGGVLEGATMSDHGYVSTPGPCTQAERALSRGWPCPGHSRRSSSTCSSTPPMPPANRTALPPVRCTLRPCQPFAHATCVLHSAVLSTSQCVHDCAVLSRWPWYLMHAPNRTAPHRTSLTCLWPRRTANRRRPHARPRLDRRHRQHPLPGREGVQAALRGARGGWVQQVSER